MNGTTTVPGETRARLRSASLSKPTYPHTTPGLSITSSHPHNHLLSSTNITVWGGEMPENESIQLNTCPHMVTSPILPGILIVTTLINSIESLGLAQMAAKVLSGDRADSRPDSILNIKAKNIYNQGVKELAKNDFYSAIEKFTSAIEINPKFARAYHDRGIARYKLGDKQLAVGDLTAAIELNPYHPKYYSNRGFMLARLEDYAGAIADYNSALLLNPNLPQAYFSRGTIRLQMENCLAALADFESAIRLAPDFAKAYFNRGMTRYKLREIEGGVEDFEIAAELFKQQGKMDCYQDAVAKIQQL